MKHKMIFDVKVVWPLKIININLFSHKLVSFYKQYKINSRVVKLSTYCVKSWVRLPILINIQYTTYIWSRTFKTKNSRMWKRWIPISLSRYYKLSLETKPASSNIDSSPLKILCNAITVNSFFKKWQSVSTKLPKTNGSTTKTFILIFWCPFIFFFHFDS